MSKNVEASEELLPCPGKRLKIAREAKGIDLAHAAEQLHLSRAMINALEAEAYEKLPARVFVRGYYKNYARLVGVSEETILQEFDDRCPDGDCKTAPPVLSRRAKKEVRSNNGLVRLITWLIIISLVAMLVVWWQGYLGWPAKQRSVGEVTTQQEAYDQQDAPPIGEEDSAATKEMDADVIPSIDVIPVIAGPVQQTAEENGVQPEDAKADTADAAPPAVEPISVQPPVVAEISVPVKPELTVMFSGDCWVDIRDSTRQFKLFGKMSDGDMRKLSGEPPYKMVFGNYLVAKLMVDGKPYDLSAHANGNTAKFTFDPATAQTR